MFVVVESKVSSDPSFLRQCFLSDDCVFRIFGIAYMQKILL